MKYCPKSWSGFVLDKVLTNHPHPGNSYWQLSRRVGEWTLDLCWYKDDISFWLFADGDKYRVWVDKEEWVLAVSTRAEHGLDPCSNWILAWDQESVPADVDVGLDGNLAITCGELLEVWYAIGAFVRPL